MLDSGPDDECDSGLQQACSVCLLPPKLDPSPHPQTLDLRQRACLCPLFILVSSFPYMTTSKNRGRSVIYVGMCQRGGICMLKWSINFLHYGSCSSMKCNFHVQNMHTLSHITGTIESKHSDVASLFDSSQVLRWMPWDE